MDLEYARYRRATMIGACVLAMALAIAGVFAAGAAYAAPFAPASLHKGRSALVYDTSSLEKDGPYTRAWVYLIVRYPMDGASMVAYRREFACASGQSHDLARRFVDPAGRTIRAIETPTGWQALEPDTDDFVLMEQVCGKRAPGPATGKGMSVFDYHDAVQSALAADAQPVATKTAAR